MQKDLKIKISIDKKTGELKVVGNELDELNHKTKQSAKSFDSASSSIAKFAAGAISIYAVNEALSNVIRTGLKIESMMMSLEAAVGSTDKLKDSVKFLKETSNQLGLSFEASIDGFTQFASAAKQTALEGQGVKDIFHGVSEASAVMGLSVDDQNGVFRALSQMMSKGKVQAEELRGQLGERLPGAFQIAARSMNMTTAELDKFMSDGKLVSDVFLPNFAKQLEKEMGQKAVKASKTARAEQNRYNNALLDMKTAINDAGINQFAKDFYHLGSEVVQEATHWLHEWNVQVDSLQDISKKSGVDKLKEQYKIAADRLETLKTQQGSFQKMVSSGMSTYDILASYGKSEVGLNAEIIKQKAIMAKLEKTLNAAIVDDTKIKSVKDYNQQVSKQTALTSTQIKQSKKLYKEYIQVQEDELKESQKAYKYKIEQQEALNSLILKEISYKQQQEDKKYSNQRALEDFKIQYLDLIGETEQAEKLKYKRIAADMSKNPLISEKQIEDYVDAVKKSNNKAKATFQDWGDTLNSSISNSLVDAIQNGDVSSAVDGLGASIASSMIQASSANIVNSAMGKNVDGYGGLMSMGGLGGIANGVGISLAMDATNNILGDHSEAIQERVNKKLLDFTDRLEDATHGLNALGNTGSVTSVNIQMLQESINNEASHLGIDKLSKANVEDSLTLGFSKSKEKYDAHKKALEEYRKKLDELIYDNLGDAIDYSKKSISELKEITDTFNVSNGERIKMEIERIAILIKQGAAYEDYKEQLQALYTQEDYVALQNYSDALDSINDAYKSSMDNLLEWTQRNETLEDTAKRLGFSQGVNIANSEKELKILSAKLAASENISDAELEFLKANEEYLKSISTEKTSLQQTLDKLKLYNDEEELLAYNRGIELETIDDSNKALQQAIYAQEDYIKTQEEATQALEDRYAWELNIAELQASVQDKIADATYNAMKATRDYADSLEDLAKSSISIKDDLLTQNMSSKDKEFYFLSKMNESKNSLESLLSAGGDYDAVKSSYDSLLSYIKDASDITGVNYQDSLLSVIEQANTSLDNAGNVLDVQIVSSAVDMAGLTAEQLEAAGIAKDTSILTQEQMNLIASTNKGLTQSQMVELGLAEDTSVSSTNSTLETKLSDLIALQTAQLQADTAPFTASNSYAVNHVLGATEEAQFAQVAGSNYKDIYSLLYSLVNAGTQNEDFDKLIEFVGTSTDSDNYKSLIELQSAGMITQDTSSLISKLSGAISAYNTAPELITASKDETKQSLVKDGLDDYMPESTVSVDELSTISNPILLQRAMDALSFDPYTDIVSEMARLDDITSLNEAVKFVSDGKWDFQKVLNAYGVKKEDKELDDWIPAFERVFKLDRGYFSNITGYANGGVSTAPQMALVSEGAYKNEAHVPLPDGRAIPVNMSGVVFQEMLKEIKDLNERMDDQNTLLTTQANEIRALKKATQDIRDT